VGAIETDV